MSELKLTASSDAGINITDITKVGDNDHGYAFGVGRLADLWISFAIGRLPSGDSMMFFLPGIGRDHQVGHTDRELVIKLTGAIAQAPEHGYGGIARWFVDESLRGKPDEFRCGDCDEIGCQGECADYDDMLEYYIEEAAS